MILDIFSRYVVGWMLAVVVAAGGLRLSWHMWRKGAGKGEDPRYTALLDRHGGNRATTVVTRIFATQALAQWVVALPILVSAVGRPLSGVEAWRRDAAGWVRERRIGADEGLPAVESTGLAVDPQRRVWLGTRRGLFRIDPNLRGSRALLRNFGVREGLLSQELNDRGLLMTADGLLATTAADGSVALLDTHLPDPKPVTPNLVVDSLQVSRGDSLVHMRVDQPLQLQPGDHELLVGTRLLSYENPLGNRYRSLLEGFDGGWVDQGASGERVFSALTPGRYRLRMQVRALPDPNRIPWLNRLKATLEGGLDAATRKQLHEERARMDAQYGSRPHAVNAD